MLPERAVYNFLEDGIVECTDVFDTTLFVKAVSDLLVARKITERDALQCLHSIVHLMVEHIEIEPQNDEITFTWFDLYLITASIEADSIFDWLVDNCPEEISELSISQIPKKYARRIRRNSLVDTLVNLCSHYDGDAKYLQALISVMVQNEYDRDGYYVGKNHVDDFVEIVAAARSYVNVDVLRAVRDYTGDEFCVIRDTVMHRYPECFVSNNSEIEDIMF